MTKMIQFGAGSCLLPSPWINFDRDCDITKPLPIETGGVDVVFAEMVLEHVSHQQAWNFLDECHRLLKPGGLIRIVIPDFSLTWRLKDPDYARVNGGVTGATTWKEHARSILFCHGHAGLWNSELLRDVMEAIGFRNPVIQKAGVSAHEDFKDIEQHWRSVGRKCALSESGCVEAVR